MVFYKVALVGLISIGVAACSLSEPVNHNVPYATSYPPATIATPVGSSSSKPLDTNLEALLLSEIRTGWFTSNVLYDKVSQLLKTNGGLNGTNIDEGADIISERFEDALGMLSAKEYLGLENDYILLDSTPNDAIPHYIKRDIITYNQFVIDAKLDLTPNGDDAEYTESEFNLMVLNYVNGTNIKNFGELRKMEITLRLKRNIRYLFKIRPDSETPTPVEFDRLGGVLS